MTAFGGIGFCCCGDTTPPPDPDFPTVNCALDTILSVAYELVYPEMSPPSSCLDASGYRLPFPGTYYLLHGNSWDSSAAVSDTDCFVDNGASATICNWYQFVRYASSDFSAPSGCSASHWYSLQQVNGLMFAGSIQNRLGVPYFVLSKSSPGITNWEVQITDPETQLLSAFSVSLVPPAGSDPCYAYLPSSLTLEPVAL